MSEFQIELINDNPQSKQDEREENMTTAIAIKSTDGIVMASDSQATTSTTKNKYINYINIMLSSINLY
jgi:20S proteasome alpha/beta subunit